MDIRMHKFSDKVPEPTLRRLPWYLSNVKLMKEQGETYVSSTQISKQINVDASQIAKDLSYVNISGRTRVGYEIDALIEVLERFLGFTKMHKAFLFGVGSLGGALLRDSGLHHFGLEIVGAFDINPGLVGKEINGIPIYHSDEFEIKMKSCDVNIGVLTVPINIAQEITDKMIAGGIKAVWNFTPFRIRVPENIVVQNTSLYAHLAELADSRDKEETKVLPQSLERTEKLTQFIPKLLLQGDVGITVQKRSVVFVNQDNDRQTGLFIRTTDHTLQTSSRSLFLLFRPINLFTTK